MRRTARALLPVLACLALAGCGGGGATGTGGEVGAGEPDPSADPVETYVEQVRAADAVVRAAIAQVGEVGDPGDLAQLEAELGGALRGLEQVPPPYDLLTENLPLTQALGAAIDLVAELAASGGSPDPATVDALRAALAEAEAAIAQMEERGYDVRSRS